MHVPSIREMSANPVSPVPSFAERVWGLRFQKRSRKVFTWLNPGVVLEMPSGAKYRVEASGAYTRLDHPSYSKKKIKKLMQKIRRRMNRH